MEQRETQQTLLNGLLPTIVTICIIDLLEIRQRLEASEKSVLNITAVKM